MAIADSLLNASAWQLSPSALAYMPKANLHGAEIKPENLITFNLNYKQMGVCEANS